MSRTSRMSALPPFPSPTRPLERQVAAQAAEWFVLLHSGEATAAEHSRFEKWLASHTEHARAWQRAQQVSGRAGGIPSALGSAVLRRPRNRRDAVRLLTTLMVAAPVGWLAWRVAPWQQWTATYATATGEQRELVLADGSRIVLDTGSAVDIRFDAQQRTLLLRAGAILATTAPDPAPQHRPFIVATAQGTARAIGTRFTVRQEAHRSQVAVLQGAVEIKLRDGSAQQLLQAGQQTSFAEAQIDAVEPVSASAGQWARGVLAVDDMRLDAFAAELARYRPGLLRCDDAVAGLRITGAFQLHDTDAILHNVAHVLPVQVLYRTRYWVTLAARD